MKLALIALGVEICLARLFTGSWGRAVAIVILYCTFVFVRQLILTKKRNKYKLYEEAEDTLIEDIMIQQGTNTTYF